MEFSQTEKIVTQFFIEREGEEILKVIKKIDFIDEGILDSLDIISLADYLQKKFNKKIDVTNYETIQAFHHFNDIVKLIT
jgi:acyl carrier protein|tara:strand:- start:607 stop:846 length:240 start_codon:yes stop_codon:yes gene_type:complete